MTTSKVQTVGDFTGTIEQPMAGPGIPSPASGSKRITGTFTPDKRLMALQRFAASITVLTIAGHVFLGFEQAPITPIFVALWAYALEIALETVNSRVNKTRPRYSGGPQALISFLLPTHIIALATSMLLYGNSSLWPYMFAVSVAITVKYVIKSPIRGQWRHTVNPSNTGIVVVLVLFPWVGIAQPYMFTASVTNPWDWIVPLTVLALGTMLNAKLTGRMPLILGWVGGFVLQAVVRSLFFDASLFAALSPMTGVIFILFTNYMITDPGSTPFGKKNQFCFGLACASIYGGLVVFHVSFGFFFALVLTCLVRTAYLNLAHLINPDR